MLYRVLSSGVFCLDHDCMLEAFGVHFNSPLGVEESAGSGQEWSMAAITTS